MFEAARAKAQRGELRISVPVGYVWHREVGLGFDPDARLQEAIRLIFERFRTLGSARQAFLSLAGDGVHFPRPSDGKKMVSFDWTPIRYRNVISVLKNPFYAGAYVYGKSEKRTTLVDGRLRKSYGHGKPVDQWDVMLQDHHEAYIGWAEFERNQKLLAVNAYGKVDGVKSGRGGQALLSGMLCCARCGRRLTVAYTGRGVRQAVYRCDRPNAQLAQPRCSPLAAGALTKRLRGSYCAPWDRLRSKQHWKPNGDTWKSKPNNGASGSWSFSKHAMKPRSPNDATRLAIQTIA